MKRKYIAIVEGSSTPDMGIDHDIICHNNSQPQIREGSQQIPMQYGSLKEWKSKVAELQHIFPRARYHIYRLTEVKP